MMEPSTSLLEGDSPTGENMAVSGGAIVFSRTAIAVGSLACPRSTPTEYRRGEYFGILGPWYSVSHAITIRRLLSGWLLRSPRRRGHSLCRRMRRAPLGIQPLAVELLLEVFLWHPSPEELQAPGVAVRDV